MYTEIMIPAAVYREVTEKEDSACQQLKKTGKWSHVQEIKDHSEKKMYRAKLHDGEVEVMILCKEENADLAIIDDNAARKQQNIWGLR